MPQFDHQAVSLNYRSEGEVVPFIFLHGLGADLEQPWALFPPSPGIRLICFDFRGHGHSATGPEEQLGLASFAEDLGALMRHLRISTAVVGGISLGAAVALSFTLRFPAKVAGLILSRPAWLDGPNPFNVQMFGLIAQLVRNYGPTEGLERFEATPELAQIQAQYPDTANSLRRQFLNPRVNEFSAILDRIPRDSPSSNQAEWSKISVPTLVLANRLDPVHPYEYGEEYARRIPKAEFQPITSKSVNVLLHAREVQQAIAGFLVVHFLKTHTIQS